MALKEKFMKETESVSNDSTIVLIMSKQKIDYTLKNNNCGLCGEQKKRS